MSSSSSSASMSSSPSMNEKQQQQQQQRNERPLLPLPSNSRELDAEFTKFFACFKGKETEENWEQREQALQRIRQLCSGQSIPVEQFSIHLKPLVEQLLQTLTSLRSALIITCCATITDLSVFLGSAIDGHLERLVMQLMKLTAQPKKLFINLASTTISTLIRNVSLQTRLFERFFECLAEKNACVREKSVEFTKEMIEMCVKDDSMRNQLSRSQSTLDAVERLIHKALSDASQLARENAKDLFFLFQENWPDRAAVLMNKFESSVKRSLERSRSGNANKGRTTGSAARSAISALRGKLKTSQTTEDIVIFAGPRSQTAEHPNGGAASNESAPENNYRSGDSTPKDYDTENPAAMDYENDKNNDYSSQQHQQLIDNSLMMMVPAGAEGDESFMNMSMPSFSHADDFNVSFAISKEMDGDDGAAGNLSEILSTPRKENIPNSRDSSQPSETTPKAARTPRYASTILTSPPLVASPSPSKGMVGYAVQVQHPPGITGVAYQSMTPLIRRKRGTVDILNTPAVGAAISIVTSPEQTPTGDNDHNVADRLVARLELLRQGQASEKIFRRIHKLSKEFQAFSDSHQVPVQEFSMRCTAFQSDERFRFAFTFHQYFQHIIATFLEYLLSNANSAAAVKNAEDSVYMKENCLILLKHFITTLHPVLFAGVTVEVVKVLTRLCAMDAGVIAPVNGPKDLYQGIQMGAHECLFSLLGKSTGEWPSVIDALFSRISELPDRSLEIGVCLSACAWLVDNRSPATQQTPGNKPPIHSSVSSSSSSFIQHILSPLFSGAGLKRLLMNSVVANRKSLFDLLVALGLRLGDQFITDYLEPCPIGSETSKSTNGGLSLPNYKLFQVLLEQRRLVQPQVTNFAAAVSVGK